MTLESSEPVRERRTSFSSVSCASTTVSAVYGTEHTNRNSILARARLRKRRCGPINTVRPTPPHRDDDESRGAASQ